MEVFNISISFFYLHNSAGISTYRRGYFSNLTWQDHEYIYRPRLKLFRQKVFSGHYKSRRTMSSRIFSRHHSKISRPRLVVSPAGETSLWLGQVTKRANKFALFVLSARQESNLRPSP